MACSVCRDVGHNKGAHLQFCVICGGDETVVSKVKDIDKDYRCADSQRHERIRKGFGDPAVLKMR